MSSPSNSTTFCTFETAGGTEPKIYCPVPLLPCDAPRREDSRRSDSALEEHAIVPQPSVRSGGSIDLLLYLCVTHDKEIWYSGDALLRFAGLIAAGLVGFKTEKLYGHTPTTSGQMGSIPTVFHGSSYELGMKVELHLTGRGIQLVHAWRTGNEQQFRALISQPGMVPIEPSLR